MYNQILPESQNLPVANHYRKSTDVIFTVFHATLSLTLFIVAVVNFSPSATKQVYFDFSLANQELSQSDFSGFRLTFWLTVMIAFALGFIWLAVVHLATTHATYIAHIGGIVVCLIITVFSFIVNNDLFNKIYWLRFLLGGLALICGIVLTVDLFLYRNQLRFQGIMLKYALNFLSENPNNFLYLLVFLLLMVGLVTLLVFQHICFSNISHNNNNYWDLFNPGALGVLNVISFLWGYQFLLDAFLFIISGNAIDWYWQNKDQEHSPFHRFICNNYGSVVAGSFMNSVIVMPAMLVQLLVCHPTGCCQQGGNSCYSSCGWLSALLSQVRTDVYSYINLYGFPYYESCRECQRLCSNSNIFQGYQSPVRNYKNAVEVLLVSLGIIFSYIIVRQRVEHFGLWMFIDLIFITVLTRGLFVSFHAAAAEGIQTSFLVELSQSKGYDSMRHCNPSYRNEIQALQREHRDG